MIKQLLLFGVLLLSINAFAQTKSVNAVRINSKISLDGILDEEAWQKAYSIKDFLQQEPKAGSNPTFATEAKILYDDKNIYIGVICYDDDPSKIIARELKWDGFISADDNIKLIFDTFDDNRSAYWFGTNPLGAKDDALLTGFEMSGFNESWNGVWDVECRITEKGWIAEYIFPLSTFKFFDIDKQKWGFNIQRTIKRFNEDVIWTSVGQNLGLHKIASAGDLIIEDVKRGNPVYLKPYFTAGAQITNGDNKYVHEPGLDVKYGVSETLSLDVTLNTDFAQVESDRAKINLSRFPLFFPEKREFFLEGMRTFDFSLGGSNTLFYSRRIGISNGKQIRILGGAKLVGRMNNFEIGFLDMQTEGIGGEPTTNYGTARIKYDLLESSYVGFLFTNKMDANGSYNRSFGGDVDFSINDFLGDKNLIFHAGIAKSDEKNGSKDSWAGNFYIDYPNDLIDTYVAYRFIQKGFNPAMGFVSRGGVQQLSYKFSYSPRINTWGIKKLQFEPASLNFYYDDKGNLESSSIEIVPLAFTTESGDEIEIGIERSFDNPKEDFELFDDTKVLAGKYWFNQYSLGIETSPGRIIYSHLNFSTGEFYNGTRSSASANFTLSANKNLTLMGDYSFNTISINGSKINTNEIGTRVTYNFSTRILSSLFAQWNNESHEINLNYRLNWKPKLGSDVYLVLNQLVSTDGKIQSKDFAILAKVVWMITI